MEKFDIYDLPYKLVRRIRINPDTGCWEVQSRRVERVRPDTYPGITYNGKPWICHVLAYCLLIGLYPRELQIDHVYERGCRSKQCCNPAHLEVVTQEENLRRGREARKEAARDAVG
jgi:hypothetical protein